MPRGIPTPLADRADDACDAHRIVHGLPRQHLERHDDQRIAGKNRQWLAERAMDRRLAASEFGVVETRQVVVDQRRAVQQLDRRRRRITDRRPVVTAGRRYCEAQTRAQTRAARKHRMPQRGCEQGRRIALGGAVQGCFQGLFDPGIGVHGASS